MAEDEAPAGEAPKKRSKLPILLGLALMAVLGGVGFYATFSGLLVGPHHEAAAGADPVPESTAGVAFVPIDPLVISLDPSARSSHLRFSAQLEVDEAHRGEVTTLMPRVLDVLNCLILKILRRWCGCGRRCCAGCRSSPAKGACATCS